MDLRKVANKWDEVWWVVSEGGKRKIENRKKNVCQN